MKISSVCVVGGGTSGWMLAKALEKHTSDIEITIVESPRIGNIGVGESTIPSVSNFIKNYLGFDEKEWMPYCDAVYKSTIKFNDFKNKGDSLYHPFWSQEEHDYNPFDWAVKNALDSTTTTDEYYESYYLSVLMSRDNKFSNDTGVDYAHHMDATKFGHFCKDKCSNNVNHILGHIVNTPITEDGQIKELHLEDGRVLTSDLFVDCSGFASILLGKALQEPFVPSKDYLLNDSAIVARLPFGEGSKEKELLPYTDCTALSSGWAWNIPLWSRIGTGYVYSSNYLTEAEATEEFKEYLISRYDNRVDEVEFKAIKIKAGRHERSWVGNCASLVLSTGFVEPLESTGLALMCHQVEALVEVIRTRNYNSLDVASHNKFINSIIDDVVAFVSLHYSSTNRTDTPYWKFINTKIKIPTNLIDKLKRINNPNEMLNDYLPDKSWENILIGFEVTSSKYYNKQLLKVGNNCLSFLTEAEKKDALANVTTRLSELSNIKEAKIKNLTSHFEFLSAHIYKEL